MIVDHNPDRFTHPSDRQKVFILVDSRYDPSHHIPVSSFHIFDLISMLSGDPTILNLYKQFYKTERQAKQAMSMVNNHLKKFNRPEQVIVVPT